MRQLFIQSPQQYAQSVLDMAKAQDGVNLAQFQVTDSETATLMTIIHVGNSKVENLLESLQQVPDPRITLSPQGVFTLHPPPEQAAEQVTDVEPRSPIEVFLAGLQGVRRRRRDRGSDQLLSWRSNGMPFSLRGLKVMIRSTFLEVMGAGKKTVFL